MGRSSYSDLSIPRSDSCAKKGRIKECPWNLSSGTSERVLGEPTLPLTPRKRGGGGRERETERDELTIASCLTTLRLCQRPVQLVKLVSPRDMERWWLASTVERLLVIDLATGPWLSVGCISICDSS